MHQLPTALQTRIFAYLRLELLPSQIITNIITVKLQPTNAVNKSKIKKRGNREAKRRTRLTVTTIKTLSNFV